MGGRYGRGVAGIGGVRGIGGGGGGRRQVAGMAATVKCIVGNLIFLDEIAFCSIKGPQLI